MKVNIPFNQEGVKAHNYLRKLHGCPPLKFDIELANSAQAYAEVLASKNAFQHSGNPEVGENLAKQSGSWADFSAAQTVILWYNEIKLYKFDGQDNLKCGHFSQVIWKGTKSVGMGKALCKDGCSVVVVGQYQPPGNYMGEWGSNVLPVLRGQPRPLTLVELVQGMKEDVHSEEKENMVFVNNSVKKISETKKENIQKVNFNEEKPKNQVWKNYINSNGYSPMNYAPSKCLKEVNGVCDDITKRMQSMKKNTYDGIHDMGTMPCDSNKSSYLQENYPITGRAQQVPKSSYQSHLDPLPLLFKEEKLSEGDMFAMNVYTELNHIRQMKGLKPFQLSNTFDGLAREVAKDIKEGGIKNIPSGIWRDKLTCHYAESSYLFDKNANRFAQRCLRSRIRKTVLSPDCEYAAVGCDFCKRFKKSVAVILFA
nr:Golgi associated plant pathogenesis [Hymenolepis microstoma]